jgi:uncharacterized protein (UPF0248 family)
MTPIHELLSRIRWDAHFARGEFELGYFDRVEGRIIVVPFRNIGFPADDSAVFRLVDVEGLSRQIPLHRVREVRRDGQRIWHRSSFREKGPRSTSERQNLYDRKPVATKKDALLAIPVKRKRCGPGKL